MTRIAVVQKGKCNPTKCSELCLKKCPVNRMGEKCIINVDNKAQIDEELCNGCGICQNICPFEAVHIINLPQALDKAPIHQFGKNGFRLFKLPIPIFGKVVGIVGRNGIGKTTAVKILAGLLKPNFGNLKTESTYKDLINYFKGTEAQSYFEKVHKKEITISYKPQQVDMIPKSYNGKVKDLLKKVDETGKLNEIIEKLDLKNVLDNDIKKISGGELQRVAIAATVLKKANLYFFDEPTSYLDIKQRIKVSKFIRSLADEKTAVMVVEHDLIILDYLTDLVHMMYGKETCYGICSMPKSTRAGINVYLSGFLKEENIRFRDKEIKFTKHATDKVQGNLVLTEWKNIKKKLGNFNLQADSGIINRQEVVGILGENGIGKTTFAKILAGVTEADQGQINKSVKVSYKPQYLETKSDELVINFLQKAFDNYKMQLIRPLNIKQLQYKKLHELSGGELQRVSVAHCLSQEADLYLLDEPSAYLDVEQRLIISKLIQDFMEHKGTTALIVDHDLLFIDYLSHRLIVFDGKPAVHGVIHGPFSMQEGMNKFLKDLNLTFRRDPESGRPRANKPESIKDREQKADEKYYYG